MSSRPWCVLAVLLLPSIVLAQDKKPDDPLAKLGVRDLLPRVPKSAAGAWRLVDAIEDVPEVMLEDPGDPMRDPDEAALKKATERLQLTLDKIRRLDEKTPHGFLEAIARHRPDFDGLDFRKGKAAEMDANLRTQFHFIQMAVPPGATSLPLLAERFPFIGERKRFRPADEWLALTAIVRQRLGAHNPAALTQILQGIPHDSASVELAKIAIYSTDPEARKAAIQCLGVRRLHREWELTLLHGLEHPLASVVNNAADALIALELNSPRTMRFVAKRIGHAGPVVESHVEAISIREVVKVNHLRNCALCHPPSSARDPFSQAFPLGPTLARVPNPCEKLPESLIAGSGYGFPRFDPVAIDFSVTYLRPDFSLMATVPESTRGAWPAEQLFDYLVRTRVLRPREVDAYRKAQPFLPRSATHHAALRVLRGLSGLDAGSTRDAWETALNLPPPATPEGPGED